MRLPSPLAVTTVTLYILLAVTYAFPTSLCPNDAGLPVTLERRVRFGFGGKKTPAGGPSQPPAPMRPAGQNNPGGAPGGVPRLGATDGPAAPAAPATDIVTRGRQRIDAMDAKMRENPPSSGDWVHYSARIKKYSVVQTGVPGKKDDFLEHDIQIFGMSGYTPLMSGGLPGPAWSAKIYRPNTMSRENEFRKGQESDSYYRGIPEADRVYTSDHIANTWKEYGDDQPMTTNKVSQIKNNELETQLNEWTRTKGNPMTIGPNDPEWTIVMGSSAGAPLAQAVTDYPDIFKRHVPTQVTFDRLTDQSLWNAEFSLTPAT